MNLRVVTWNMQSVFPVRSHGKWGFLEERVRPDVAVIAEAKPDPKSNLLQTYQEGGLGPRRRWGTVVAAKPRFRTGEVQQVEYDNMTYDLYNTAPGSVVVCDVFDGGERLLTIAGVYAMTVNDDGDKVGHGGFTTMSIVEDLVPLFDARQDRRIVIAGDLNLWPNDAVPMVELLPVVDLVEMTASARPESPGCVCESSKPCHHIWTHNNSFKGKFQQIDFMFATDDLADRLSSIVGGPEAFPDIWEWSDHAPLVAEFELQ